MSALEDRLAAGEFTITSELSPVRGASAEAMKEFEDYYKRRYSEAQTDPTLLVEDLSFRKALGSKSTLEAASHTFRLFPLKKSSSVEIQFYIEEASRKDRVFVPLSR